VKAPNKRTRPRERVLEALEASDQESRRDLAKQEGADDEAIPEWVDVAFSETEDEECDCDEEDCDDDDELLLVVEGATAVFLPTQKRTYVVLELMGGLCPEHFATESEGGERYEIDVAFLIDVNSGRAGPKKPIPPLRAGMFKKKNWTEEV
jgi:hypothetical protein